MNPVMVAIHFHILCVEVLEVIGHFLSGVSTDTGKKGTGRGLGAKVSYHTPAGSSKLVVSSDSALRFSGSSTDSFGKIRVKWPRQIPNLAYTETRCTLYSSAEAKTNMYKHSDNPRELHGLARRTPTPVLVLVPELQIHLPSNRAAPF